MKAYFTEEQIIGFLQEAAARMPVSNRNLQFLEDFFAPIFEPISECSSVIGGGEGWLRKTWI